MNGLELYTYPYAHIRFSADIMQRILDLESRARTFTISSLDPKESLISGFLAELEEFLSLTSEGPYDYCRFSTEIKAADAVSCFWMFASAPCRITALCALKPLVGGTDGSFNGGELRTITALARFLKPEAWSALSWRVLACLGFQSITQLRDACIPISKQSTIARFSQVSFAEVLLAYSTMEELLNDTLPTISQVTVGLYNISLEIWPIDLPFDKTPPLA